MIKTPFPSATLQNTPSVVLWIVAQEYSFVQSQRPVSANQHFADDFMLITRLTSLSRQDRKKPESY